MEKGLEGNFLSNYDSNCHHDTVPVLFNGGEHPAVIKIHKIPAAVPGARGGRGWTLAHGPAPIWLQNLNFVFSLHNNWAYFSMAPRDSLHRLCCYGNFNS